VTEAVFLDAGGVLVLPDFDAICAELGASIDHDVMTRAHYAGMVAVDRSPTFSWWNYNRAFVDAIGFGDSDEARQAVDRAYIGMEWHLPIVDSMGALPALEARYRVAVVSNSDGTVEDILRRRGVTVPTIIDSHHVGVAKPDPAIFEVALEAVDVDRARAVHIGDSVRFDVAGARAAGIRPLHYDPFMLCVSADHDHIRSLRELL
jgi:putative hydrolase of the HAD superfamily